MLCYVCFILVCHAFRKGRNKKSFTDQRKQHINQTISRPMDFYLVLYVLQVKDRVDLVDELTLRMNRTQRTDNGTYECQVVHDGSYSLFFQLSVIPGEDVIYITTTSLPVRAPETNVTPGMCVSEANFTDVTHGKGFYTVMLHLKLVNSDLFHIILHAILVKSTTCS